MMRKILVLFIIIITLATTCSISGYARPSHVINEENFLNYYDADRIAARLDNIEKSIDLSVFFIYNDLTSNVVNNQVPYCIECATQKDVLVVVVSQSNVYTYANDTQRAKKVQKQLNEYIQRNETLMQHSSPYSLSVDLITQIDRIGAKLKPTQKSTNWFDIKLVFATIAVGMTYAVCLIYMDKKAKPPISYVRKDIDGFVISKKRITFVGRETR